MKKTFDIGGGGGGGGGSLYPVFNIAEFNCIQILKKPFGLT